MDPNLLKKFLEEQCEVRDEICLRKTDQKRVRAVLPVHFAGLCCDMDTINELAKKYNLSVIEDAAHAFPTRYKGRLVGKLSPLTVFSFYATKTVTTGEGGMIVTDNDQMAERMRVKRSHGISKDAWKRYPETDNWYYEVIEAGFKYNLTDIAAAMGLHQLDKAGWMRNVRQQYAEIYTEAFKNIPALQTPYHGSPDAVHAWHLYALRIWPEKLKITRSEFIEKLREIGIGTSVGQFSQ